MFVSCFVVKAHIADLLLLLLLLLLPLLLDTFAVPCCQRVWLRSTWQ
jgi:hypothetical protein